MQLFFFSFIDSLSTQALLGGLERLEDLLMTPPPPSRGSHIAVVVEEMLATPPPSSLTPVAGETVIGEGGSSNLTEMVDIDEERTLAEAAADAEEVAGAMTCMTTDDDDWTIPCAQVQRSPSSSTSSRTSVSDSDGDSSSTTTTTTTTTTTRKSLGEEGQRWTQMTPVLPLLTEPEIITLSDTDEELVAGSSSMAGIIFLCSIFLCVCVYICHSA